MEPRLYNDLAWLWPLWGDPGEYQQYCKNTAHLIRRYADREISTLLNVSCGGGKNIYHLKNEFAVTGLDISPSMLALAEKLNPECQYIQADMRDFSTGTSYDAILIDDGISYIQTLADLRRVFICCYDHLNQGGVMLVGPDHTSETFIQNESHITQAANKTKPADIDVLFIENYYDPDPTDTSCEGLILFIIRENGVLRVEQDVHHLGVFPLDVWRQSLNATGFKIHEETYSEAGKEYVEFVCLK